MSEPRILTEDEIRKYIELTDVILETPQTYGAIGYYQAMRAVRNKLSKMIPAKLTIVKIPSKLPDKSVVKSSFIESILSNKDLD